MAVRILYNVDTWDAATITSSSEASTDMADDNVVHDFVDLPWRTTGDTSEWIKFDLGSATKLTCIGLFAFNFTSAATVTLEANATDAWGSPSYSQVLTIATDSDGNVLKRLVFFLDQTYRWWRITIADAANPDTYIQIGRILAGEYYEPDRTINDDPVWTMYDPSEGENIPGRQTFKRQRNRYRLAEVGFMYQDRTQSEKLQAIFDKIGTSKPCILALDPTNYPSKDSAYCYMTTPLALAWALAERSHTPRLTFEEKVG